MVDSIARVRERVHPVVFPCLTAVAAAGALAYLSHHNPHEAGHYPTCPSLLLFGVYCPGCGSLRALHGLTHGDFAGAWDMNPLAMVVLPWLLWRWLTWLTVTLGAPARRSLAPGWVIATVASGVVVYAIARNIPHFAPYLAP